IPQQCPLGDLITDQLLLLAYLRAFSISLLGCLAITDILRLNPDRFEEAASHREFLFLLTVGRDHFLQSILKGLAAILQIFPSVITSGHSTSWPM
ncbi:MAG TPA: hypothetical protein VMS17_23785, partial [Gemmataceae bacterium]|nr:hypothetical protein [Gemmataceae bacterium]